VVFIKSSIFWNITRLKLKIEGKCSSETSVGFERTKRPYVAQDSIRMTVFYMGQNLLDSIMIGGDLKEDTNNPSDRKLLSWKDTENG
jgi:hypothetical protein